MTFSRWQWLSWPVAFGIAGSLVAACAAWLCIVSADQISRRVVLLLLVLTLPKLFGLTWYLSRIRAGNRRQAGSERHLELRVAK